MEKLDHYRLLKTYICLSSIIFLLESNVFAQTYHDCTSTQDFNNLLEQNSSTEELSIGELSSAINDKAFGLLLIILSLPSAPYLFLHLGTARHLE